MENNENKNYKEKIVDAIEAVETVVTAGVAKVKEGAVKGADFVKTNTVKGVEFVKENTAKGVSVVKETTTKSVDKIKEEAMLEEAARKFKEILRKQLVRVEDMKAQGDFVDYAALDTIKICV